MERKNICLRKQGCVYKKDRLYIQTSGGGGWGNPLERDKKALKCDVKDGLISQERAEKEYGGC